MRLAISVATCLLAGWIGSLLTRPSLAVWYQSLVKPDWTPPSWLFAPVWTTLYVLMAIAAWLVWRRTNLHATAMKVFLVQLVLNVIWSAIFFALRSPGWAFFEVTILWCAILATALAFRRNSSFAAWLMVPYLAWVSYAAALNLAIWRLNA